MKVFISAFGVLSTCLIVGACSEPARPASEPAPVEMPDRQVEANELELAPGVPPQSETSEPELAEPSYRCVVPPIPIPRPRQCAQRGYPRCKWQMPHATLSGGRYRRWRNTIMEHWWGRPALVAWLLASLDAYEREFPDQVVAVGDLDAPGPRHRTHDNGVDVDLYLLGALMVENAGAGAYPSNYDDKTEEEVEALRLRVETMARILATCSNGALRIYYNDPPVLERFNAWYAAQGFPESPFEHAMVAHNHLHDFHFHVSIAEDLAMPEMTALPDGERHPRAVIEAPPPPGSAPHLSSMNRRRGDWAAVPMN